MNDRGTTRGLELRADLIERVEARLPRTEFDSTEAYVEYVLEEVLSGVEATTGDDSAEAVDEGTVRERLQALGYAE